LNYIQVYDLDALDQPPCQAVVENGYAQSFDYNPIDREIYVYNQETQRLLVLDATTLELKKAMSTPQVSPGDAWVVWDQFSDNIVIASEADEWQGFPFIVVNRTTGEVVDAANIESGNIMLHPTKPILYLGFFRRGSELLMYDTQRLEIVRRAPADEHLNRLAFIPDETGGELLIASPVDSQVLRFNAETLEYKGAIPSLFGVRTIAVDPLRRLLVAGSLVTNRVEVIDLTSQQRLAEFYIGPWLRTISLDTGSGLAYISTHEGLFTMQYTDQD
jgi:DNA-binding beta-propeller fold protein YncE